MIRARFVSSVRDLPLLSLLSSFHLFASFSLFTLLSSLAFYLLTMDLDYELPVVDEVVHTPCTWTEEQWLLYLRTSEWITYVDVLGNRKEGWLRLKDMPSYMITRDLCKTLLAINQVGFLTQMRKCKKGRDLITKRMVEDYINEYPYRLFDVPKKFRTWKLCLMAHRKAGCRDWIFSSQVPIQFKSCCSVKRCGNRHNFNLVTFPCGEQHFVCEKETYNSEKQHDEVCGLAQAKKAMVLDSQSTLPQDLVNMISQLEGCPFAK